MVIDLSGKSALVCGSSQGIGLGIARQMQSSGARVTLMARNEEKLKTLTEAEGFQSFIAADFSNPNAIDTVLETKEFKFDILVNNTGGPPPGPIASADWNDFSGPLESHLRASHLLTMRCLEFMRHNGYGRIINIISTSVKIPIPGLGVSNTVRGAMASWAKTMSLEVASFGITVNNLLPGFVETIRLENIVENLAEKQSKSIDDMRTSLMETVPAKRFGTVDEIAGIAAFLASDLAGYINGVSIPVDGGRTGSI